MPNYIKLGNLRIEIPEPAPVDPGNGGGNGGGGGSSSLLTGLLAFYNLSDLTDALGNRNLTNIGNVTFESGKIGNAALFDGSNYLQASGYTRQPDYSVAAWVYPTSNDLMVIYNESEDNPFFLFPVSGGFQVCCDPQSLLNGLTPANTTFVQPNSWSHVAATWTDADKSLRLYSNGVLGHTETNSQESRNGEQANIYIGLHGQYKFKGKIDALGVWNKPLTSAEITELYNAGAGKEHPFS
jgi:hypothetical protein